MTGIVTQKTQLYLLDVLDVGNEVREIENIKSIGEGTVSRAKIPNTHLMSVEYEYLLGLADRSSFPVTYIYNPANSSYQRMKVLEGGDPVRIVMGLSDGVDVPTHAGGTFTLPTTRTWIDQDVLVEAVNRGSADIDGAFEGTYTLAPTGGETETVKT